MFLVSAALLVVGFVFFAVDPVAAPRLFWGCPFHKLTGLYCPGCGGQRALHALLHGRVLEALSLNAFAVLVVAPLGAYAYAAYALRAMSIAPGPRLDLGARWLTLLAVLMILFGILRNLPFGPLPWLAP